MQSINSSSSREEGDTEEEAETEEEEAAAAVAAMARAANSGSSSKKVVQCIRSIITTTATLLLLLTFMTCPSCSGESVMDPAAPDAVILADFRNSVESDPLSKLAGWSVKSSSSVCSWHGVTCTDSRVSRLDLSSFNLQCNFSSVAILLTLQKLQSLVLSSNGVHGNLSAPANSRPTCSSSLTALDLSQNRLQGPLSSAVLGLCEKLSLLNVSGNQLNGPADSKSFAMASLRELDVSHNGISESSALGSVLSGCAKLQSLSISYNRISGFSAETLPAGGFLRHLDLSNNNISARLSDFSLCSPSLALLDLSANRFTGGLDPSSLGDCGELRTLNLSTNRLSGPIPASFGTGLGKIEKLLLSANQLQGTIPSELGSSTCKTLQELDLSGNSFTGSIPSSFISCTSLHTINLSNNKIFGPLPIDLIASLPALKSLSLAYNNITGTLPASVSGFPNLEVLELSSNHLEGEIPVSFCRSESSSGAAPPLKKLYLQNNRLSGTIPPGLADCTQLRSIDLSFNYLSGTIPPSLGSLQFLQDLVMWLNNLEGEIPAQISNIPTLENLILDNNLLNGTIPAGLRNCSNLVWISLSNNFLTGTIPAWIGGMDKLAILQLGNNSFSGTIPRELGFCKSLVWLDLNSNKLEGSIPPELSNQSGKIIAGGGLSGKVYAFLRNEAGSDCRGAGVLVEFGGIRREELIRIPMLHFCKFTRVYTGMTMYQFKDNGTMVFMDLSYNSLSGIIPDGIGSMYYLQVLNLAHNNLNGSIPQSLGGLKLLGLLDLSYNNLSGFIPPALSGLSLLTDLEVSNNNLSGEIPTGGQLSTFPANRYANNAGLCGVPLPPCSESSSSGIDDHPKTRRNQASLAGSVAMGLLFALVCIFAMIVVVIETRRKKKQEEVRDIFMDSLPTSGNGSWKFTGVLEPLSINVATFEKPLRKLTFAHLLEATNGFHADSLIGSGGFGDVYKAVLKDGTVVAIKKLIHISGQGDREFMAEMETIGKIKHRNLVPLLGYCKVGEERLLVYEYMRFGSLENVLHNQQKGGIKLDWAARKRIAIGAARGLAFLHHSCIPHIIHRDMKSSNVLIDENLEARVSDFGMARLMNAMDTHLSVSTLAGTPGYVPPEYYQSFRCTTKGDVYSYGVILLELLTGRRPTDSVDFGDNNLVGWVRLHSKMKIADVFDPELMKDPALETELVQYLKIGCECLDDRPWRRPTMIQVLAMFRELQKDGDETELDSFSLVDPTVEEAADAEV